MLSIGKLSAGQAKYYLGEAGGRGDAVESIGEGVEEYYAGGREARGEWIGSAGAGLGLTGKVTGEELRAVLAGLDPRDGAALRSSASPVRVAGFGSDVFGAEERERALGRGWCRDARCGAGGA